MKSSLQDLRKSTNKVHSLIIFDLIIFQEVQKDEIVKSLQAKFQEEREMKSIKKTNRIMGIYFLILNLLSNIKALSFNVYKILYLDTRNNIEKQKLNNQLKMMKIMSKSITNIV